MMMRAAPIIALLPLLAAACGPMSVQSAEAACFERARLAAKPRGEARIGGSNRGGCGDLDLTISSDWLAGRDPSAVYSTCVFNKSGEPPRRPLYDRPDWKG